MSEKLLLLWFRFRWIIVVVALLLATLSGALSGKISGGNGVDAPSATTVAPADFWAGSTETLRPGSDDMASCIELSPAAYTKNRVNCLALIPVNAIDGALPVDIPGHTDPLPGLPENELSRSVASLTVDLDNDTYPEIVTITNTGDVHIWSYDADLELRDSTSSWELPFLNINPVTGSVRSSITSAVIAGGDWNNDGFVDVLLAAEKREPSLWVNAGRRWPGRFTGFTAAGDGTTAAALVSNFVGKAEFQETGATGADDLVMRTVVAARIVDLDGDRNQELAVLLRGGKLLIFWGDGAGFTSTPLELDVPLGSADMTMGDVNRDGVADILVAHDSNRASALLAAGIQPYSAPPSTAGVAVYLGSRKWTYERSEELSLVGLDGARAVVAADIDNDGLDEIVIGCERTDGKTDDLEADGLHVYRAAIGRSGAIDSYTVDTRFFADPQPAVTGVVAADIDRDGDVDLVIAGRGAVRLRTWTNSGSGGRSVAVEVSGAARLDRLGSNTGALGATVEIVEDSKIRTFVLDSHNQVLSIGRLVVGLGASTAPVIVRVTFPATGRVAEATVDVAAKDIRIIEPNP